ncbi:MAG: alanine racemase [Patescibacteria group bacterium]
MNLIHVDFEAMKSNFFSLANHNPNSEIGFVIKSNAYGHNFNTFVEEMAELSSYFFVGSTKEAIDLAKIFESNNQRKFIFSMYTFTLDDLKKAIDYKSIVFNLCDFHSLDLLEEFLQSSFRPLEFNLNIDTGMHFLGFQYKELEAVCKRLNELGSRVKINTVMTHFATSDELENPYYNLQLESFKQALSLLDSHSVNYDAISYHNSASFLRNKTVLDTSKRSIARVGLAMYGYLPNHDFELITKPLQLKPVLKWVSTVASIKNIEKGALIGYGNNFQTKRRTTLALIPVGYYEGLPRTLSNNNVVEIGGALLPIVGNIRMNMIAVDVTNLNVKIGDEVKLLSLNWNAEQIATHGKTIPYEILTNIKSLN